MWGTIVSILYMLICFLVIVNILMDKRPAESTLGWIMVIVLVPVGGLFLFIIFGVNWTKRKLIKQVPELLFGDCLKGVLERQKAFLDILSENDEAENDSFKLVKMLNKSNNSIITSNNEYKFFYNGESFFEQLFDDIENAKKNIHMEYYIWRSDELGNRIKDLLIKKANEGVEVKLIFDSFGSLGRISYKYRRELKAAGIEFKYFLDLFQPFTGITRFNYRNHRKVIVIDGQISYTGGFNIGIEYLTGGKKFNHWRDTNVRLTGEISVLLQALFLTDWFNSGNKMLVDEKFFPRFKEIQSSNTQMQVAVSGPDSSWNSIKMLFFNMFANANKEVYIQSPYLVPDRGMIEVLQAAALSGVKIHLMMTGVPDKKTPFWAAATYFDELLDAGVNIYQYQKGFLHCKTVVMDGKVCSVGSTNMDIRSFKLNYEVNVVMYDESACRQLIEQFNNDLQHCRQITKEYCEQIGFLRSLRNSLCRILSPIM